jgi:hypothetical protein
MWWPVLAGALAAASALAQDAVPSTASAPVPAPGTFAEVADTVVEKPYLVDPSGPVAACVIVPYRSCLTLSVDACETATRAAVDTANIEIEAEAAKAQPGDIDGPFFEGLATGIFIRHMQRETQGRFFDCMGKAR